jgi:hypothetical protein
MRSDRVGRIGSNLANSTIPHHGGRKHNERDTVKTQKRKIHTREEVGFALKEHMTANQETLPSTVVAERVMKRWKGERIQQHGDCAEYQ